MIPYSDIHRHSVSPDRRIRMSQPTLYSSFSGMSFTSIKGHKFSYSSLRTSGDTSINIPHQEELLSIPNVHSMQLSENAKYYGAHRGSRLSQPDIRRMLRAPDPNKRERLSQPTLVTGDYYPPRMQHQRLSQPCLLSAWNEKPIGLLSPIKQKRFGPAVKVSQRERLASLDFGTRFRFKELKGNRDRFSIPELETQNDLKLIAGSPKQRFSLDSQLNPDNKVRRLLPIVSSPIFEHGLGKNGHLPTDGLESVIVATATPLMPPPDRQFLAPILKTPIAPPLPSLPVPATSPRERMSVPEIRSASLRRLLDPPSKQRHSIAGLRQTIVHQETSQESDDKESTVGKTVSEADKAEERSETDDVKPKHIQRHYSYTYDTKDEPMEVIGKLSVKLPKKKYLESNFDENEQVITTVIETEIPMILSSPKYMKKTHVYGSEAPKWMKKCLETPGKKFDIDKNYVLKLNNQRNIIKTNKSPEKNKKRITSPSKGATRKYPEIKENIVEVTKPGLAVQQSKTSPKDTCVRIKPSGNGETKYQVAINSEFSETDICRLYGIDCDTDSEDSTSV
ncbi:uncharacterized protein LOC141531973 [Cotesia typhae]|uniref:uncharacterized protein LOC141531973 n=1 Tax=Cotesia typhae TaxID=2053667 RepID=UPI003D69968C